MGSMDLKIGEKLKSIRMARTLSLDDTAVLTGVSKPMLGQIERSVVLFFEFVIYYKI